jgi:hypothetical protein
MSMMEVEESKSSSSNARGSRSRSRERDCGNSLHVRICNLTEEVTEADVI